MLTSVPVASNNTECTRFLLIVALRNSVFFNVAITSLGSELSFRLVKPILERCTADQLMRLEEASPVRLRSIQSVAVPAQRNIHGMLPAFE